MYTILSWVGWKKPNVLDRAVGKYFFKKMCSGKKNKKHRVGLNIPVKLDSSGYVNN